MLAHLKMKISCFSLMINIVLFASLTENPMVFIRVLCVPTTIPPVHHPPLPEHSTDDKERKFTLYFRPPSSRSRQKSQDSGIFFCWKAFSLNTMKYKQLIKCRFSQLIKVRSNLDVQPMQMTIDQFGNLQKPSLLSQ